MSRHCLNCQWVEAERDKAQAELEEVRDELAHVRATEHQDMTALQQELHQVRAELQTARVDTEEELRVLRADLNDARAACDETRMSRDDARAACSAACAERDAAKAQLCTAGLQVTRAVTQSSSVSGSCHTTAAAGLSASARLEQCKAELEREREQVAELRKQLQQTHSAKCRVVRESSVAVLSAQQALLRMQAQYAAFPAPVAAVAVAQPAAATASPSKRRRKKCFTCGSKDHLQKECTERTRG
jgi:chromosome segregation ATPase